MSEPAEPKRPDARRDGGGASPNEGRSNVVLVQIVLPDYRERFIALLQKTLGSRLQLYAGDLDFAVAVETSAAIDRLRVRNRFLFGRRLLWQTGTTHENACDGSTSPTGLTGTVFDGALNLRSGPSTGSW